ncbi:AraC family transcriptional regulator [Xanthomonas vesicatoria]|uniref:GyrI-like domain-containing protein n=1 Tax=Xanthomonas vesicatoria TaxID=56460 RepID=A0ABS8LCT0_9XANT|nr:GyrI-like domain-containing protein [Xanthomonas vesicatoria]MCC8623564.1 GyrI-like domain-containing protein [Xanthomonas vesicatoria]MCC8693374.1 GyrI-like domain-containing protein [Xanthomonas vesicatoria]MCC8703639.1 GyrI-like domain-containing protein [Xanthomonas vesicatoria]MDG4489942.1 helix-turn-helix domain-containing protein [Xanthomonas vesicatoria]
MQAANSAGTSWQRGVERVVAHLQSVVRSGAALPNLAELAAIAHQSPYHFHRVYRALTGEPVGQTVARLRLSQALHLLGRSDVSVTDVALAVGYQTPQALARACRSALQASPSVLRATPALRANKLQQLSAPPSGAQVASAPLAVSVQTLEPFELVVLRKRGAFDDLDRGFGRIVAWAARAGIVDSLQCLVGLPLSDHRDVPAHMHLFECGVCFDAAATPAAPLQLRPLDGGPHAVLRHIGTYAGLEDALDELLASWLPGSGYLLRDAPLHYLYLDDPEETPEAILRADIRVPVVAIEKRG